MEILGIIDKLESLAVSAKKMPVSRRVMIDPAQLLELVDQLRVAVPEDVAQAQEVLRKRDDLLNQSLDEARRMRASAENEVRSRVDDSELMQEAQKQSDGLIAEAQERAQHVLDMADADAEQRRSASDVYSQEVLYKLEQEVASVLTTIRRGIEVLDTRQDAAAG